MTSSGKAKVTLPTNEQIPITREFEALRHRPRTLLPRSDEVIRAEGKRQR